MLKFFLKLFGLRIDAPEYVKKPMRDHAHLQDEDDIEQKKRSAILF